LPALLKVKKAKEAAAMAMTRRTTLNRRAVPPLVTPSAKRAPQPLHLIASALISPLQTGHLITFAKLIFPGGLQRVTLHFT
jgi:hypothetical protein